MTKSTHKILTRKEIKIKRCPWCEDNELYIKYHDEEWGVPVHDDRKHFEFLVLESAQAGLNWITVLRKRENYMDAYNNFDPMKVSEYDDKKIEELIKNPGIIRNRRKIEASISNAKSFLKIQKEFGSFDKFIWRFVNNKQIINSWKNISEIPQRIALSDEISEVLKRKGFRFVGSTIIYAHMQAVGLVNDHIIGCFRFNQLLEKNKLL